MKNIFILIFAFACSMAVTAQKSVPEGMIINPVAVTITEKAVCPDFTITTTDGIVRNLYDELNAGKAVLLDQFYTTCGYCQAYAPIIDEAYVNHGSGSGNILFWGIDQGDTDAEVIAYMAQYGVTNPCASGVDGGGNAADAALIQALEGAGQTFLGYPTYSVVCPNKTVSWDVNYPPSATGFDSYFTNCGVSAIAEHSTIVRLDRVFPVPAATEVNFEITVNEPSDISFNVYDLTGRTMYEHQAQYSNGVFVITIDVSTYSSGAYVVKMFNNNEISQVFKFSVE